MYFVGYLIVAYNPERHTGIVLVGGIGKVGYAIQMLKYYLAGIANSFALVIVIGDLIFAIVFIFYFYVMAKTKISII